MNPKYAVFIWSSYALTFAVLAWNTVAPWLRRNELKRHLADDAGQDRESEE